MKPATLRTPHGRTVGFADYGPRGGTPLIWCGGPGCRREPEYFAPAVVAAGLRLIGIDRPGYTSPDRQANRRFGVTLSLRLGGRHSLKLVYSEGATTRRGTDFDSVTATWQLVRF